MKLVLICQYLWRTRDQFLHHRVNYQEICVSSVCGTYVTYDMAEYKPQPELGLHTAAPTFVLLKVEESPPQD